MFLTVVAFAIGSIQTFDVVDNLFYDTVTRSGSPRTPRVVILEGALEQEGAEQFVAALRASGLRRVGITDANSASLLCSGSTRKLVVVLLDTDGGYSCIPTIDAFTKADRGIFRTSSSPPRARATLSFEAVLADRAGAPHSYLVRMPIAQNIPRIAVAQLVDGLFANKQLIGTVAILASPADRNSPIATSLDPSGQVTTKDLLRASATQTLIDNRAVTRAGPFWQVLLILLFAFGMRRLIGFRLPSAFLFLTCFAASVLAIFAWVVCITYLDLFTPLSAVIFVICFAAVTKLHTVGRLQTRRLERTIENAIELSFSRSVFVDRAAMPRHLANAARLLRLPYVNIRQKKEKTSEWDELMAVGQPSDRPYRYHLTNADEVLRFEYDVPDDTAKYATARLLDDAIQRYRLSHDWRERLLEGRHRGSIDDRLRSAANLITVHGDELAHGLDTLDTGVFIFRPLGIPVHANAQMRALLNLAKIDPEKTALVDTLLQLSELDLAQAESMVRGILLQGGDMRVPMRDFGGRQRILRLGIASEVRHRSQTVLVLEAVDVSELDRLAELRLAVGTFIDRQLRNDLEAIALGASLAKDNRLQGEARGRVLNRISDVTRRANKRLENVRELLEEQPYDDLGVAYPVEARKVTLQAVERVAPYAEELGVTVDATLPDIGGFSIAEPLMLCDMIEAMLRLIIADTAHGEAAHISLSEHEETTDITVSGGFGLPFDRFVDALDAKPGEAPSEYQIASAGIAEAIAWRGSVSYWSAPGKGFRFGIRLRRV
ncbi:hypothetical protein E3U23_09420 [Erythrobacter litoralis]|uniref:hypothetical protein n=1 Tax=Erythrobacter litoralis TaxID=39960 RepID=UPI002435808F|nr:hypothetical protein [Erythrobacter litoralis]MDG6079410.1 hypothetical protein [Erythrobacter litoralis]